MSGRDYRWGAILGCTLYRAVTAALVGLPLGLLVGGVVGAHPRGDAVLWDQGGMWLVEAGRLVQPGMRAALVQGGAVMMMACFGWLLPLGALIASQAPSRPSARACLKRAAEKLGPLALILGAILFVQAAVGFGMGLLGRFSGGSGTRVGDVIGFVVPLSALVLWWLIGLLHDALRVVYIQRDLPWWESFNAAWELLRARPLAALGASGWRVIAGVTVALVVAAGALSMSGAGGSLALVVLLHQVGILLLVLLRASWLGWLNRALFATPEGGGEGASGPDSEAAEAVAAEAAA